MKLISLETKKFKVDGGAMFGVVPKVLWSRLYPSDEKNMCPCAVRSLLVIENDRKILIDTGIGDKLHPDFAKHYHLFGNDDLLSSLNKNNIKAEEITDIILTHLHFDHCGGTISFDADNNPFPVFPNAELWISKEQYDEANNPNLREKPAYLEENIKPLTQFHKVNFIEEDTLLTKNVELRLFFGHTKGLISVFINYNGKKLVFAGDVMPALPYLRLPYISAYDIFPLRSIEEKQSMLREILKENGFIFFQHDIDNEACNLTETKKGIRENKILRINEI